MPRKSRNTVLPSSTKRALNSGRTPRTPAISSLRRQAHVISIAVTVPGRTSPITWTIPYSRTSSTRLLDTVPEVLASICLGNPCYVPGSLLDYAILNERIETILASSLPMEFYLTTLSLTSSRSLTGSTGRGDRKRGSQRGRYKNSPDGGSSSSGLSKKSLHRKG